MNWELVITIGTIITGGVAFVSIIEHRQRDHGETLKSIRSSLCQQEKSLSKMCEIQDRTLRNLEYLQQRIEKTSEQATKEHDAMIRNLNDFHKEHIEVTRKIMEELTKFIAAQGTQQ